MASGISAMAVLSAIDLSSNKCFGDKEGRNQYGNKIRVHDNDKNQTGWNDATNEGMHGGQYVQIGVVDADEAEEGEEREEEEEEWGGEEEKKYKRNE